MGGSFFRHLDSWQVRLEKLQTENVQTVGLSDEAEWNRGQSNYVGAFCKLANPSQILARCVHFESFSINTIVLKAPSMMTELQTAVPQ